MSTRRVLFALLLLLGIASGASAAEITHRVEIIFFDDYDLDNVWDSNEPEVGMAVQNCNRTTYREGLTDAWLYGTVVLRSLCGLEAICDYTLYSIDGGPGELCLTDSFIEAIQCTPDDPTCG